MSGLNARTLPRLLPFPHCLKENRKKLHYYILDLFSLYHLFSHFRPSVCTPENCFFKCHPMHVIICKEIVWRQKANTLENITWFQLGYISWLRRPYLSSSANSVSYVYKCILPCLQTVNMFITLVWVPLYLTATTTTTVYSVWKWFTIDLFTDTAAILN